MAWIVYEDLTSSAGSEASAQPSGPGSEPSPTVRTIDTARLFYCHECDQVILNEPLSGTTSHLCKEGNADPSKLFSAGSHSHAKTFPLQDAEKAWAESEADYFSRSCESLARYDHASSSWKMCRTFVQKAPMLSSGNWPASGMTVAGMCYPLKTWARITDENDGGSWPTPQANKTTPSGEIINADGTLWDGTSKPHSKKTGRPITTALADKVKMWPTPKAHETMDKNMRGNLTLNGAAKLWPTPRACDADKNIRTPEGRAKERLRRKNGEDLPTAAGGQLNADWVSLLMGYPAHWTVVDGNVVSREWLKGKPIESSDSDHSGTPSCRRAREKPLRG